MLSVGKRTRIYIMRDHRTGRRCGVSLWRFYDSGAWKRRWKLRLPRG